MLSNHLTLCCSLLLLPSVFPNIGVFSNELALCIRWPKYWSFSFSISPSSEYSGLISFRIDWLNLLAVQGTLKSLLQHHSSKASVLPCSAFMVQRSYPYMSTKKIMALTIQTCVSKMSSLLFSMLSRFVLAFLPRSKCLLISWLQLPSAVILEPQENLSLLLIFPNFLPWSMGPDAIIFLFWMLRFKPAFHCPLSTSSRSCLVRFHFLPLEWYYLHIWDCWYFSQQSWFQLVVRPAQNSAWKLNKQGGNIQLWHIPFPILNQSVVLCKVLTVASWCAYRFLRTQIKWSGIPISLRIFHSFA